MVRDAVSFCPEPVRSVSLEPVSALTDKSFSSWRRTFDNLDRFNTLIKWVSRSLLIATFPEILQHLVQSKLIMAVMALASWLLYFLHERPVNALKKYLLNKLHSQNLIINDQDQ